MVSEGQSSQGTGSCKCKCCLNNIQKQRRKNQSRLKYVRGQFLKKLNTKGSNYEMITSIEYLNNKYGLKKTYYIEKFINCIHKKIDMDVSRINDEYIESLDSWVKIKLFLLLIALSQRGGPEYWLEKSDAHLETNSNDDAASNGSSVTSEHIPIAGNSDAEISKAEKVDSKSNSTVEEVDEIKTNKEQFFTLTEQIMRQNIKQDFTEKTYNENYVFSSIWANFMEGLINHYLEKVIIPHSEMKVCQQLYKPMMKIISLYNEYNELIEKSERNGFLPLALHAQDDLDEEKVTETNIEKENNELSMKSQNDELVNLENDDLVAKERLQKAQKLLWQARQDIPKTISKELTLLSEMYSTLSADEQDYKLDEFVGCAEEYIELEYLPSLIDLLYKNCGVNQFWKLMIVLEPYFYYIEEVDEEDENEDLFYDNEKSNEDIIYDDDATRTFKPDPRVITLEKICEVAAKQKWI